MSVKPIEAGGVFRVAGVLRRAWRLLAGNILLFLAVPAVIYTAIVLANGYAIAVLARALPNLNIHTQAEWVLAVVVFLSVILPLALNMIGQAVIVLAALPRLRGQPFRSGEVLQSAMARAYPMLGLVLLWSLALGLCVIASILILSSVMWGFSSVMFRLLSPYPLTLLPALLFPASLVPTAILLVMSTVIVPACIVEGLGPLASMIRSAALTKRCRWKIFGMTLLLGLLTIGGGVLSNIVMPERSGLAAAVDALWFVPLIAYWNAAVIMTYHDLRVAKEGFDTGPIAAVFD